MKILALSYEYPPIGGGGGVVLKNILERLNPTEFSITLITTYFENLAEHEITNNIEIFRVRSKRKKTWQSNPFEMLSWVKYATKKAEDLLTETTFDIVLSNFVIPGGMIAIKLLKKHQLPYVCISHGHDIPWVKPRSLYPLYILMYQKIKRILINSTYTVTLSPELQENAKIFIGRKHQSKIKYIPNGCDENIFYPQTHKKNEIPKILFVGRLVSQKGINTLLKTAKLLKEKIDFELLIIGDGPMRKNIEKFIQKNALHKNIKLLGQQPHEKMPDWYRSADILFAPSISEGMSMVALEAAFCELYIITSNVSGMKNIIINEQIGKIAINPNCKYYVNLIYNYIYFNLNCNFNINFSSLHKLNTLYKWALIAEKYQNILKNIEITE